MKIPFDIKYRPQIESGEYKVETRDGNSARIICWDKNSDTPIVALVTIYSDYSKSFSENVFNYGINGCYMTMFESHYDLFIVTPELSKFENRLCEILDYAINHIIYSTPEATINKAKELAPELLAIAREELEPEVLERLDEAYKNQDEVVYENGKRDGKAEALKDLPRWREWGYGAVGNSEGHPIALVSGAGGIRFVSILGVHGEKYIMLDDLEKLPGFKED